MHACASTAHPLWLVNKNPFFFKFAELEYSKVSFNLLITTPISIFQGSPLNSASL
jgi:hypothetical protein